MGCPRIAEFATEALPPIDDTQLATKSDLRVTAIQLRGEMAELRGERGGEFGKVRAEAANNLRLILASQFTTAALIIGWISASTRV